MKKTLILLGLLSAQALVYGQGTVLFTATFSGANEVPPNSSIGNASASLELIDTTLYCSVGVINPMQATEVTINGSSSSGSVAPVIFQLPFIGIAIPNPPSLGSTSYGADETLTASQVSDLLAAKWYINIDSAAFPNGELRGQIVSVPEPSRLALLSLVGGLLTFSHRRHILHHRGA